MGKLLISLGVWRGGVCRLGREVGGHFERLAQIYVEEAVMWRVLKKKRLGSDML